MIKGKVRNIKMIDKNTLSIITTNRQSALIKLYAK